VSWRAGKAHGGWGVVCLREKIRVASIFAAVEEGESASR